MPDVTIPGIVQDADSVGLPGIEVLLEVLVDEAWIDAGLGPVVTEAPGDFTMVYPEGLASDYRLAFSEGGTPLGISEAWIEGGPPDFVTFVFVPTVAVPGTVIDLTLAPLDGITVRLEIFDADSAEWIAAAGVAEVVTDGAGAFVMSYPAGLATEYRLSFLLVTDLLGESDVWNDAEPPPQVDFQAPLGTISVPGTVTDLSDLPVANVTVKLQTLDLVSGTWVSAVGVAPGLTDSSGNFTVTYPPALASDYRLSFSSGAELYGESTSWRDGAAPTSVLFQAPIGGPTLILVPGTVTDSLGAPMVGVTVTLQVFNASTSTWEEAAGVSAVTTDAGGGFSLTYDQGLANDYRLSFDQSGPLGESSSWSDSSPPSSILFQATPAGGSMPHTITGLLTNTADGLPAANVVVKLEYATGDGWQVHIAAPVTSADGRYTLDFDTSNVASDHLRLSFSTPEGDALTPLGATDALTFFSSAPPADIPVTLRFPVLQGTITHAADGLPVQDLVPVLQASPDGQVWSDRVEGAPSASDGNYSVPFAPERISLPFVRVVFRSQGEPVPVTSEPEPSWPTDTAPPVYNAEVLVSATAETKPAPQPTFVVTPLPLLGVVADPGGTAQHNVAVALLVDGPDGQERVAASVSDTLGGFSLTPRRRLAPGEQLQLVFGPTRQPYRIVQGTARWAHADPPQAFVYRVKVPAPVVSAPTGTSVQVFGTLRTPEGRPLPHTETDAQGAHLRPSLRVRTVTRTAGAAETPLAGPVFPGDKGDYTMSVTVPAGGLSFQVVAEIDPQQTNSWEEVARSPVVQGSGTSALVDIPIVDGRMRAWSESDQCAEVVQGAITSAGLDVAVASTVDDEVIAAQTRLPRLVVTHCRQAIRLKQEIEQAAGPVIALQIYYALLAMGFPRRAYGFAHATADRARCERAMNDGVGRRILRPAWLETSTLQGVLDNLTALIDLYRVIDRTYLLNLDQYRTSTPLEVESADASLGDRVATRLVDAVRTQVTKRVETGSPALRDAVLRMEIQKADAASATTVQDLLMTGLRAGGADTAVLKEAEALQETSPEAGDTNRAGFDVPLLVNPVFAKELATADFLQLGEAMGLAAATVDAVAGSGVLVDNADAEKLSQLVTDGTILQSDADAMAQSVSIYRMLDRRRDLVSSLRTSFPAVTTAQGLVDLQRSDWDTLVNTGSLPTPGQMDAAQYADGLHRKVQNLFPTRAVNNAQSNPNETTVRQQLDDLAALGPGSHVATADFDAIDTSLTGAALDAARTAHQALRLLHLSHPGLGLVGILDDTSQTSSQRASAVTGRTQAFQNFLSSNPNVLSADLRPGSADLASIVHTEPDTTVQPLLEAGARGYQRARAFTRDTVDAVVAVEAGYSSSLAVVNAGASQYAADTGLSDEVAKAHVANAKENVARLTAGVGALLEASQGAFNQLAVSNIAPPTETLGFLKELPGFADFFGLLDYCDCRHCQSILSPAAYFVDLMCFVDMHVNRTYFAPPNHTHPLHLKTRRPDLWTLELTCDNTHELVPYLEIINEILENYIATLQGYSGDFQDRAAVATLVYRDTLKDAVHSFRQPFHLPFEEIRVYLDHFEPDLREVAQVMGRPSAEVARLSLGLSDTVLSLITTPNPSLAFLTSLFGITFFPGIGDLLASFDAQLLLERTQLSRHDLQTLIETQFVTDGGAASITVTGEKSTPESVQNDVEMISGLTAEAVDRMHRMVRLWRATPWTLRELDLVVAQLAQAGLSSGIDAACVEHVAELVALQSVSASSVEEVLALVVDIPQVPTSEGADALFNRLFNLEGLSDGQPAWPQSGTSFLHPALALTPPSAVPPDLHRLQAGTRTSEDGLYQLIVSLGSAIGVDPSGGTDAERSFSLSLANLSLLVRHAQAASILKLSIPELFELIRLAPAITNPYLGTFADTLELFRFHAWMQDTRWEVDDLSVMVRRTPTNPAAYPDTTAAAQALVSQIAAEDALLFAPTVFAFLDGVTETQSEQICRDSTAAIEPVSRYRTVSIGGKLQHGDRSRGTAGGHRHASRTAWSLGGLRRAACNSVGDARASQHHA